MTPANDSSSIPICRFVAALKRPIDLGCPPRILIARSYAPFVTVNTSFDQIPHTPPIRPYSGASPAYELSCPANSRWLRVKALREGINYGNTTVIYISARPTPRSVSVQKRWELQPQEISALLKLTDLCGVTDEELELIDMRYQQALALMNLETLFAEGQLDCM
jgi:hypothetical protein